MELELSPLQQQAIDLFVSGEDIGFIAQTLGIGRTTLWRWRKLPAFERAYAERMDYWRDTVREEMKELIELSLSALNKDIRSHMSHTQMASAFHVLRLLRPEQLFSPATAPAYTPEHSAILPPPQVHS